MIICPICGHNNLAGNMTSRELSGGFINCRGCQTRLDHTGKEVSLISPPIIISQLIKQLEDIKAEHGDLPVYYMDNEDWDSKLDRAEFKDEESDPHDEGLLPKRVLLT
jgi:hypothetical protein